MLNRSQRRRTDTGIDKAARQVREQLRPLAGNGESRSVPESSSWFDGEKTRIVFLPGFHSPDDAAYLPPPFRPNGESDKDLMLTLKRKHLRRRLLI